MSRCFHFTLSATWPGFGNLLKCIVASFEQVSFKFHVQHPLVFQLLERLTSKGKRQPEFTRELIKNKLTDDEDGIATTNLKVSQILLRGGNIIFNML